MQNFEEKNSYNINGKTYITIHALKSNKILSLSQAMSFISNKNYSNRK